MSADKRKLGPLDSFVPVTKKTYIAPSLSEQIEPDQSDLITIEVAQPTDDELTEQENVDASVKENFNIIDSHPDTHNNDTGFQLSLNIPLTNEIKYRLLTKPFRPDKKYKYPNQQENKKPIRRFMASWLVQHSFLVYSPYYEGAFCSACSLFSHSASNQTDVMFVNYPCSQYRHLKNFSQHIKNHINSKSHQLAVTRAANFVQTFENPSSAIDYQLDRNRNEVIEQNKSILLSIIKVVITCARQNIALRGHRGEIFFSSPDNLIA
jgi:hypothetical protein